jgi:hypothetical protein
MAAVEVGLEPEELDTTDTTASKSSRWWGEEAHSFRPNWTDMMAWSVAVGMLQCCSGTMGRQKRGSASTRHTAAPEAGWSTSCTG